MLELFIFLATLVETLNELTFGRFFGNNKQFPKKGWVLLFTALGYGELLAFGASLQIVAWLASQVAGLEALSVDPTIDTILTGVLLSGGARVIHKYTANRS